MPVAILAVVLLALPTAASAAAEPIFQFTGRGNGHGIGMSQWGAKGLAMHGYLYPSILSNYYRDSKLLTVPAQTVTVYAQMDNAAKSSWAMRSVSGDLMLTYVATGSGLVVSKPLSGSGGRVYTFTSTGDGYIHMVAPGVDDARYPTAALTVREIPVGEATPMMVVASPSGPWDWANVAYRGGMQIVSSGSNVKLYNRVGLEDYVTGVVPRESPASWPVEQLKAQAVAARSYVMATSSQIVYCTTGSQVYNGYGRWNGTTVVRHTNGSDAPVDAAVSATAGQVLVDVADTASHYTIVSCYFFDTSGGATEAVQNVWTSASPDKHLVGGDDPYEIDAGSPYHIWYERKDTAGNVTFNGSPAYSASVLRSKLLGAGVPVPAKIVDVVVTKRGPSGRVMGIVIKGAAGDDKTLTGSTAIAEFRRTFGWGDTWFYVTSFRWDSASLAVPAGGSVTAKFHLSPAVTGDIKGLIKDGKNTGTVLHVVNGAGSVKLTAPGRYWVDSSVYNSSGRPDPAAGDVRGTQFYVRNLNYPLTVWTGGTSQTTALTLGAVGFDSRVALWWTLPSGASLVRVSASTTGYAGSPDEGRVVYEGALTSASDAGLANGTRVYYTAFSQDGAGTWSTAATASAAPAPLTVPTKLTIARSLASVRLPAPFVLSGTLKPGADGDMVVAEVQKPGSARWSYSSARLVYGGVNWWYRYIPKLRGTYRFRARFDGGGGHMPSATGIVSVLVR